MCARLGGPSDSIHDLLMVLEFRNWLLRLPILDVMKQPGIEECDELLIHLDHCKIIGIEFIPSQFNQRIIISLIEHC